VTRITAIEYQNSRAICPISQAIGSGPGSRANLERPPCSEILESNAGALFPILDAAAADARIGAGLDDYLKPMNTGRSTLITYLIFSLLLVLGLVEWAHAQETEASVQQMMTPEEFRAAGLNKLSPEERQKLDAWLQGYRETTQKATEKATEKKVKQSFFKFGEPMLSRVDGSFSGLRGHTVIKLQDGTVWRQANSDDHYGASPIENPGAMVVHTGFGYKMRIQGVPEFYVNPAPTH
jgi:hypothetical protein